MKDIDDYTKAVSTAQKILSKAGTPGKPAALPKPPKDPEKAIAATGALFVEAGKKMQKFTAEIDHLVTASMDLEAVADQYVRVIKASDFGLDDKDPKNKKIIADVTTIMLDALKDVQKLAQRAMNATSKVVVAMSDGDDGMSRL